MPRIKLLRPYMTVWEVDHEYVGDEGETFAEPIEGGDLRKRVSCVPDRWDLEDGLTPIDLAVKVLDECGASVEASSSQVSAHTWFSGNYDDTHDHIRHGTFTEVSVHPIGFTDEEVQRIAHIYRVAPLRFVEEGVSGVYVRTNRWELCGPYKSREEATQDILYGEI